MLAKLATLTALLPLLNAQASYGSNPAWTSLPGSLYGAAEPWGTCGDASWPQSSVGRPLVPQAPDAELREMLAEIDVESEYAARIHARSYRLIHGKGSSISSQH